MFKDGGTSGDGISVICRHIGFFMKYNILSAIDYLVCHPCVEMRDEDRIVLNRSNVMGDSLEDFVERLLAQNLSETDSNQVKEQHFAVFSYAGSANSPPDIMYKGGDAFEVKKMNSARASLSLNSSYSKNKLYVTDTKINDACKECEDWTEKDIFYIVGHVQDKILKHLWMVHGACYAADKSYYERVSCAISEGIESIADVELSNTNELARVNKVDPLGITYLRVRGMWGIEHPAKVFGDVYQQPEDAPFSLSCIMTDEKYQELDFSFNPKSEVMTENIRIQSPNNTAQMLDAKLITYSLS